MKAFIDRNYFIYKHDQKYKARVVGLIIVADKEGIEDTRHTLKQFADEFGVEENKVFITCGYAGRIGDAKNNLPLVADARRLGRQIVESLKAGY